MKNRVLQHRTMLQTRVCLIAYIQIVLHITNEKIIDKYNCWTPYIELVGIEL